MPSAAQEAEQDPETFLSRNPAPVIIDEIQYAPGLFRHLKRWVDAHRETKGQILLTGSQKFQLMKEVSDSLAGRCVLLELEGLAWDELGEVGSVEQLDAIIRGGYPQLYAEPGLDRRSFYRPYVSTYLERDVRAILNVVQLRDFERFLRACALRSGQVLNKAELARDVGIRPSTANEWLSVLQTSNQVLLLEPWLSNRSKTLVKSPKLYMADMGMLCFLAGIKTTSDLLDSSFAGAVWETFIFSELRKLETFRTGGGDLFYWRDRDREVDFLVHEGGKHRPLEVKFTETPTARDARSLREVIDILGAKTVKNASIACRTRSSFPVPSEEPKSDVTPSIRAISVEELDLWGTK